MELESEFSVIESVEDNEEIGNGCVYEKVVTIAETTSYSNGSFVVEDNEAFSDWKHEGHEANLESVDSPPADFHPEISSSPTMMRKGIDLKKWRRIKRNPNKSRDSIIDAGKMLTQDLLDSGVNSCKRMLVNGVRRQKSVGSVSSTNAVVGSLGSFGSALTFATDADSQNSEHQSGKSSSGNSAPKIKHETGMLGRFLRDKNGMCSLSGKNLMHSVHHGQPGKDWIDTTNKVRGEQVRSKKENSHSGMESKSRNSNFLFTRGSHHSITNGMRIERQENSEGENGEAQGSKLKVRDGHQREYEDLSPEAVGVDSLWEVKNGSSQNLPPPVIRIL